MLSKHFLVASLATLFLSGCGSEALSEREALNLEAINAKQEALAKPIAKPPVTLNIQSINKTQEKLERNTHTEKSEIPKLSLEGFNHTQGDN